MSKLDGRLTTSEKQISGQATEISNLQSDVLKQKGEYTDLIKTNQDQTEKSVSTIQNSIKEQGASITALKSSDDDLSKRITNKQTQITAN